MARAQRFAYTLVRKGAAARYLVHRLPDNKTIGQVERAPLGLWAALNLQDQRVGELCRTRDLAADQLPGSEA